MVARVRTVAVAKRLNISGSSFHWQWKIRRLARRGEGENDALSADDGRDAGAFTNPKSG
jgi:hypothetical protein